MPWGLAPDSGALWNQPQAALLGGSLLSVSPLFSGVLLSLCLSWGNSQPEAGKELHNTGGQGWGGVAGWRLSEHTRCEVMDQPQD